MRILVGMSGGIDSTFAAYRLMSLGHEVSGAVIDMHGYSDISAAKVLSMPPLIPTSILIAPLFL